MRTQSCRRRSAKSSFPGKTPHRGACHDGRSDLRSENKVSIVLQPKPGNLNNDLLITSLFPLIVIIEFFFCVSHVSTFWPKSYVKGLFNAFSSFQALLSSKR
jgi:hypothetical protein